MSPARRRAAVVHVRTKLGVSERCACKVLGQPRAVQRHTPRVRDDEDRLTGLSGRVQTKSRWSIRGSLHYIICVVLAFLNLDVDRMLHLQYGVSAHEQP